MLLCCQREDDTEDISISSLFTQILMKFPENYLGTKNGVIALLLPPSFLFCAYHQEISVRFVAKNTMNPVCFLSPVRVY